MNPYSSEQLRHTFSIVSGATPSTTSAEYWDGDIPWVTPEDLSRTDSYWLSSTRRYITSAGHESSGTTIAPADSIVVTKRAPIGQLAILKIPACSNQGCFLLIPRDETDTRFYYYWLHSRLGYLKSLGRGSTFMELSIDDIKSIHIPVYSLSRQQAIADYLDRKVACTDSLLVEKERVLALLAEKRATLITRAVTRGLNSDVPLRDAGAPWLQKIPKHWGLERARWLFRERNQRSRSEDNELLTVSHLTGVTRRSETVVHMFEAKTTEDYKICRAGDLVINTLWAWMGAMGVAPMDGIVSPAYNVYEPIEHLEPDYVDALVRLPVFAQEVGRYSKGVWSSRLRLYPEGFYGVSLPLPPLREQREIVTYVRNQNAELRTFRIATERTRYLLKERRMALISAAVAGQLDVRSST